MKDLAPTFSHRKLEPTSSRRRSVCALLLGSTIIWSCEGPQHPQNAKAEDEICGPACHREHQCNPSSDEASCLSHCKNLLSPRSIYWSDKLVSEFADCSNRQACTANMAAAIDACTKDAAERFEASPAAQNFCAKAVEKNATCGDRSYKLDHCIFDFKKYSEAIIGQLTDCLDDPCRHYGRCVLAILGEDPVATDKDRVAESKRRELPQPRSTVTLSGKIVAYNENQTTIPGAKICVHDDASIPCATSAEGGIFSMDLPAARDLAIEVAGPAPEFAPIVFGFPAHTVDADHLSIGVPRTAALVKRYQAFGATYPDTATGFIRATAFSSKVGANLDAVTVAIDPKSGSGPSALTDDATSQRKTVYHSVAFAGVAPGVVEVVFGPSSFDCTLAFGAWSSGKPNTVRVPVVAGFETQVAQHCN